MLGPIQFTLLFLVLGLFVLYGVFLNSLYKSTTNGLTKASWLLLSIVLPVFGVALFYAMDKRIEIRLT